MKRRTWVPNRSEDLVTRIAAGVPGADGAALAARLNSLADENTAIHCARAFNLNPATNVMNPAAAAMMARGLGERPSLGYPGDKYETGLGAIEEIEVITAALACEVFQADYAEVRVGSGALANLYVFMATCRPGDTIIVPPPDIGGHVTHHPAGCAGLYGLRSISAPVAADGYTVDVAGLRDLAEQEKPRLITLGGSLNLWPHPVAEAARIARDVGAQLMVDAAHQCGMFAGGIWPDPLAEGAHVMTMSTYKSLAGPPGGLIVTNDAEMAERLDRIAFPGMTANFDAGRVAALAVTLLDWQARGQAYAQRMVDLAQGLAKALLDEGVPVFGDAKATGSHQFALEAGPLGGGQTASQRLEQAGFLTCGIGLPRAPVEGDLNGLRIGTPELARIGVAPQDIPRMARLIALGLNGAQVGAEVGAWRKTFTGVHYTL
ncbi:MAG: aminotransferase class I/II-fold pyridoxal phosphate-dependent enzyme [Pseudomonadota bacterium]